MPGIKVILPILIGLSLIIIGFSTIPILWSLENDFETIYSEEDFFSVQNGLRLTVPVNKGIEQIKIIVDSVSGTAIEFNITASISFDKSYINERTITPFERIIDINEEASLIITLQFESSVNIQDIDISIMKDRLSKKGETICCFGPILLIIGLPILIGGIVIYFKK